MKKYLYFSLAAMALASCTSDEFVGGDPGQAPLGNSSEAIGFSSGTANPTRGTAVGGDAAEKLGGNFIVYGFKTSAAEAADGTTDQKVFDRYNVNYEAGTANTTESNTANWEYVGYTSVGGVDQSIKYWDFSATGYVFSAVSGTGITATKTTSGSTVYDKGWTVTVPAGGDISTLYASDRLPVAPANYKETVKLTFRALGTKIRFAMYEVIPGYSVKIDKFYYDAKVAPATDADWKNTETNFAINGTFKTANADAVTPLTITYYDDASGIENRPKVTFNDADVTTGTWGIFGANIQAATAIGTTSAEATYDQSDKSYTMILPFESTAGMDLYVDYTLTSTDGSDETIKVKHASAKVPTNFVQWKPNFAYTYIFKISDNTNGTTGNPGTDPNDPTVTPTDPVGLFPITFDAVVITDETDVQETITSVSDPSITTYQKGVVVTKNDEYEAGTIFFEDNNLNVTNYHVYEVKNFGSEPTTEEVVANWKNNFCVLTEVTTYDASTLTPAGIPLSNGTYINKTAGQAKAFAAEAGKTYVIANNDATVATQYKVVKVTGSTPTITYTVGSDATIDAVAGTATINVKQGTSPVLGVTPNFTVTSTNGNKGLKIVEAGNGNYTVSVDPDAIAAGKANDTYTVSFDGNDVTITVNIAYVLRNAADDADVTAVTIVAGNTTGATVINKIADAAADGEVIAPAGITVEKTATGIYKITAAADLANGAYTVKIANQSLTVNVDSYAFLSNLVIDKPYTGSNTGTLTLQKNGAECKTVNYADLTGGNSSIATGTEDHDTFMGHDGFFTLTAVAGGTFDVTYENAKATVTVNEYSLIPTNTIIDASTGSTNLTLKLKNSTEAAHVINAVTSKVAVAAYDGVNPTPIVDPNYTLTTNGQSLIFRAVTKGNYSFTYIENGQMVAQTQIRVQ